MSCGERISLLALADAIGDVVGHELARTHVEPRSGDVRDSLADITRARELLGFEPQVRWRDGLATTIAALRDEHGIHAEKLA